MALIVCPECGANISERARECPKCGFPIEKSVHEQTEMPMKKTEAKSEGEDTRTSKPTTTQKDEYQVLDVLSKYLMERCKSEKCLTLNCYGTINEQFYYAILEWTDGEEPLLIFNYCGKNKQGFAITKRSFCSYYDTTGVQRTVLSDISNAEIRKYGLADMMVLLDSTNRMLSKHFLTGLDCAYEFVFTLCDVFFALKYPDQAEMDNETRLMAKEKSTLSHEDVQEIFDEIMWISCRSVMGECTYVSVDVPFDDDCKKYNIAVRNFGIKNDIEYVFVIYDETMAGNCSSGFVITTLGIVIRKHNKVKRLAWKDVLGEDVNCSFSLGELHLGDYRFRSIRKDAEVVSYVLKNVKREIRKL